MEFKLNLKDSLEVKNNFFLCIFNTFLAKLKTLKLIKNTYSSNQTGNDEQLHGDSFLGSFELETCNTSLRRVKHE